MSGPGATLADTEHWRGCARCALAVARHLVGRACETRPYLWDGGLRPIRFTPLRRLDLWDAIGVVLQSDELEERVADVVGRYRAMFVPVVAS